MSKTYGKSNGIMKELYSKNNSESREKNLF